MSSDLFGNDADATVTGAELAEWLEITPAGVTQAKKRGVIRLGVDGRYNLKESVQAYIKDIRGRKKASTRQNLDEDLKYWQVENAKTKNVGWRRDYGRQLIRAYRDHHRSTLDEFRRAVSEFPKAVRVALQLADAVKRTDVDEVLYEVTEDELMDIATDAAE